VRRERVDELLRQSGERGKSVKKPKTIPPMTVVKFTPCKYVSEWIDSHSKEREVEYPFTYSGHYLCLGEIRGMSGHIAVVDEEGRIRWAYHTEDFTPVPKDEL